MYFDIELLQRADKDNNRLLMKARILDYLSKTRAGADNIQIRTYLLNEYGIDYKRIVADYTKELNNANLIKNISEESKYRYILEPDIKPNKMLENRSNREMFKSWIEILKVYDFLPFYIDFESTVNKLMEDYTEEDDDNDELFPIIKFETRSKFPNKELIFDLYDSIETSAEINFSFHDFTNNKTIEINKFQPYIIKEHQQRWYIVGKIRRDKEWRAYSIGRISDLEVSDLSFKRKDVDFDELWSHSMGIYLSWKNDKGVSSNKPIRISFEVKNGDKYNNIDYLKSKPLHSSQKLSETDHNEYVQIRLKMFPDTDLVRSIRSIGLHNIKNIKPKFFKDWVIEG